MSVPSVFFFSQGSDPVPINLNPAHFPVNLNTKSVRSPEPVPLLKTNCFCFTRFNLNPDPVPVNFQPDPQPCYTRSLTTKLWIINGLSNSCHFPQLLPWENQAVDINLTLIFPSSWCHPLSLSLYLSLSLSC